jgi:hypothetical protein
MAIYLYKKTHRNTGLNYLGKTTQDPFKYKGSGTIWVRHIKKHGNDVDTVILKECATNEEVKSWGLYYSNLWNVVESKEWANIKPEEGEGGSVKGRVLLSMRGRPAHNKGKPCNNKTRKSSDTRSKTLSGRASKLQNCIRPRLSCICCKKVVDEANFNRYHKSC